MSSSDGEIVEQGYESSDGEFSYCSSTPENEEPDLIDERIMVKTLYDRHTKPSRISSHTSGKFVIVKFDKENTRGRTVWKTLQGITDYVDEELGNAPEESILFYGHAHQQQVIFIVWMPTLQRVIGYLSAMEFLESYQLRSFVDGVLTIEGTTISEPVLGITRLWSYGMGRRREEPLDQDISLPRHDDDQNVDVDNDVILQCLLDVCRMTYTEGTEIMKSHLAFEYLTDELVDFLNKYLGYSAKNVRICLPISRRRIYT